VTGWDVGEKREEEKRMSVRDRGQQRKKEWGEIRLFEKYVAAVRAIIESDRLTCQDFFPMPRPVRDLQSPAYIGCIRAVEIPIVLDE
jgi:hypothetical protein